MTPARDLAARIEGYLTPRLADGIDPDQVMAVLANVIRDAAAWRSYWDPTEIASRAAADLDARRELDDADAYWTPDIVADVHATAQRLLQREAERDPALDHPGGPVPAW